MIHDYIIELRESNKTEKLQKHTPSKYAGLNHEFIFICSAYIYFDKVPI